MTSSRFSALLQREWMQHKIGWLVTLLAPPVLFLLILPFGHVDGVPEHMPVIVAMMGVIACMMGVLTICLISATFQLPSLARRDVQDRSIEFWLSLPASHSESIGATLLAHIVLMPLVAAVAGFGWGYIVASALALKVGGVSTWMGIPWGSVVSLSLPLLLRVVYGFVLALLWLAPLVMIVMNASAWLKRWGIPALAVGCLLVLVILPKAYGIDTFNELLNHQWVGAMQAVITNPQALGIGKEQLQHVEELSTAAWALPDALAATKALASANLIGGLVLAGAGFALLVFRRSRAH